MAGMLLEGYHAITGGRDGLCRCVPKRVARQLLWRRLGADRAVAHMSANRSAVDSCRVRCIGGTARDGPFAATTPRSWVWSSA